MRLVVVLVVEFNTTAEAIKHKMLELTEVPVAVAERTMEMLDRTSAAVQETMVEQHHQVVVRRAAVVELAVQVEPRLAITLAAQLD